MYSIVYMNSLIGKRILQRISKQKDCQVRKDYICNKKADVKNNVNNTGKSMVQQPAAEPGRANEATGSHQPHLDRQAGTETRTFLRSI